ncbi:MAG: acyl-CoA dehydrogenase family protein [Desulfobacter sp.]
MDFSLTREQKLIKKSILEFAKKELNEIPPEYEKNGRFNRQAWEKCADFGLLGLSIPQKYGGQGLDLVTCAVIMEALGYACEDSGLLFSINSQIWTCGSPILKYGTEAQKDRYLPGLVKGTFVGGHAMTETDSGSDAFSMKCEAHKEGDKYILNGNKIFITNAPIADFLIVFAVTDPSKKFAGISAFIVEKNFPGFSVGEPIEMMGLRTSPIGEVILNNCEVPAANLLGKEGAGHSIFNSEMEEERSCLFATHLGAMEKMMKDCVKYTSGRHQFGKALNKNQAISHKIADMKVRVELSRLILYKVAHMKDSGKRAYVESAIAKLFISEGCVQTFMDAVQIHGAYGYCTEFGVERKLRDSIASKIYSGSSEIQRNLIADFLN